jgi:hypothetical protein
VTVSIVGHARRSFFERFRIRGRPCRQTVDVPVVHAKRRGDEDRIVNFMIGRSRAARPFDIGGLYVLSALLYLARDCQQRL